MPVVPCPHCGHRQSVRPTARRTRCAECGQPLHDSDDDDRPRRRSRAPWLIAGGVAAVLVLGGVVAVLALKSRRPATGPAPAGGTAGPAAAAAELAANGSFEDGPEPDPNGPGFTVLETGSAAVPGWRVTQGSVDYIGPYWQHSDGRRSLDLNGNEPGTIAQTVRTRPGRTYRVTFRLASNCFGGDGPTVKTVEVRAAGARGTFSFDAAGRTYEDMGWVTRSWTFTATGPETELEFASRTDAPPSCGPALDRVSVVEVGN